MEREGETGDAGENARMRELLYRALLEMRVEMREVRDQMQTLVSTIGIVVPRDIAEQEDFPGGYEDLVVVRDQAGREGFRRPATSPAAAPPNGPRAADARDDDSYGALIKDVVYEVEHGDGDDGPADAQPATAQPAAVRAAAADAAREEEAAADAPPETLPTLEEAEYELIKEALQRFDGNRRQTARALGISERTLYRKIKEIDEDV